jgi:hypothetical protein
LELTAFSTWSFAPAFGLAFLFEPVGGSLGFFLSLHFAGLQ